MKDIKPSIYKMATKASHLTGDIGEKIPDICSVYKEDEENFYGSWVFGGCFVDVKFPKATTRDLTPEEVEYYHGRNITMCGFVHAINIKNENFRREVKVIKNGTVVSEGSLTSPLKIGGQIVINVGHFASSNILSMNEDKTLIHTRNSTYIIEYLD